MEDALAQWAYRGSRRPAWAVEPAAGQESVWDYPRPPRLETDSRSVRVVHGDVIVAESKRAVRVLETASPPTFYLPPTDVRFDLLTPAPGASYCEWKGRAGYWSLRCGHDLITNVAWSYEHPHPEFEPIRGYLSFYPSRVQCYVGGQRARPQPGEFYGGWVTSDIVGPFKGEPGTNGW